MNASFHHASFFVDLLNAKSDDGRSVFKAIDFLLPYIGQAKTAFPYQQIKDWDSVQEKLRWQLYRLDKMLDKTIYSIYYPQHMTNSHKEFILY